MRANGGYIVAQDASDTLPSSKVRGYLDWGKDNLYPQKLIAMVSRSPTAGTCVKRRSQFIAGNGLLDSVLAKLVINRQGQTLDQLLRDHAWNLGFGECMALHIGYNGNLKVNSLRFLPFQNFRYAKEDSYGNVNAGGVFPYLGSTLVKGKETVGTKMQLFNPDQNVVAREVERAGGIEKYNGQIMYLPMLATGDVFYHKPDWEKAKTAIQTEAELLDYDYKQTVNNFAISGFYETYKGPAPIISNTPPANDGKGNIALPKFDVNTPLPAEVAQQRRGKVDEDSIQAQFAKSMGNRKAGNVIFVEHTTQDGLKNSKFTPVTGAQLSERNGTVNDRVPVNIARAYEVPLELINVKRSGALSTTGLEVEAAVNLMFQTVNDYQRVQKFGLEWALANWYEDLGNISCEVEQLDYFKYSPKNGIAPTAG